MWERACSRRRWVSHLVYKLTLRIREQARSHSFNRVYLSYISPGFTVA